MSVQRLYRCDLCGDGPGKSPLHGIYWEIRRDPGRPTENVTRAVAALQDVETVEHHVCRNCIRDIVAISQQLEMAK